MYGGYTLQSGRFTHARCALLRCAGNTTCQRSARRAARANIDGLLRVEKFPATNDDATNETETETIRRLCPGTLFTIGRTTVFWRTPVVRPPYDMRGYSRRTSYVRRPCAGRKFRRKSTTSTEMSYDLLSCAYIWKTFLFLPFLSFLVYTEVTSFYTSPQHIKRYVT